MPEFGACRQGRQEPFAGDYRIRLPGVISDERPFRSGHGRQNDNIGAGEQDATPAIEWSGPQSPHWGGLRDRATGPGDAEAGGGAWQTSPGPNPNYNQIAPPTRARRGETPPGRKAPGRFVRAQSSGSAPHEGTAAELPKRHQSEVLQPPSSALKAAAASLGQERCVEQ